jgi:uncharacterized pyridoxamine 5'-phosphate oxidase family protein
LLHVTPGDSKLITDKINHGDLSEKPGWVRMSIHPTMTNEELYLITNAVKEIVENIDEWKNDYIYSSAKNEYIHKKLSANDEDVKNLFLLDKNEKIELIETRKHLV